ncbi:MAG: hypothetical protein H7287_12160 [Thermoleophilia bacterium]|nr:hypothetical protein [Thermoleophilia bacterium]MCW2971952.1 hypothetical protein [Thermoleophilia bacterium]
MANRPSVAARAAEPTPENPIRAQKQRQSVKRASQRFEETVADLKTVHKGARVEVDSASGWARTVRGNFRVGTPIPPAQQRQFRYMLGAREMGNHPAAAFMERFSALFGLDDPMEQLFLRGVTPLSQGDWFAFGIDIFAVGRGAPAQIDVVIAPNGAVLYAGFGSAGAVPGREA